MSGFSNNLHTCHLICIIIYCSVTHTAPALHILWLYVRRVSLSLSIHSTVWILFFILTTFWSPAPSLAIRYCITTSLSPTALWPPMWKALVCENKLASQCRQLHSSWSIAGSGLGNWGGGSEAGRGEKKPIIAHFLFPFCTSNFRVTRGKCPSVRPPLQLVFQGHLENEG